MWRRVLILTEEPEIAQLARKHFCSSQPVSSPPSPTAETTHKEKKERNSRVLDFFALALAFAGWFYAVLTPEPNFSFGTLLLTCAIGCSLLAVWEYFSWKWKGKISSSLIALSLLISASYGWHIQRVAVAESSVLKSQTIERELVHQLLTATMNYEPGDNLAESSFIYTNGSAIPIKVNEISILTNKLIFQRGSRVDHAYLIWRIPQGNTEIDAGGDGQSDPILQRILPQALPIANRLLVCADLKIGVNYSLISQPTIPQSKYFRFATRPGKTGLRWLKEDIQSSHDFCNDKVFQNGSSKTK